MYCLNWSNFCLIKDMLGTSTVCRVWGHRLYSFDGNQNQSKKGSEAQVPRKCKKIYFLKEMVLLKRMIPMILLYLTAILTKLSCILEVTFSV